MNRSRLIALAAPLLGVLSYASIVNAQSPGGCTSAGGPPQIAGTYVDNFGGVQGVYEQFWVTNNAVFEICTVDNDKKQIIARNHSRNQFGAGKFSRFEWTQAANRLWYCQIVYDAATEQEAAQRPAADTTDPGTKGCGTFPWSSLVRLLP